MRILLTNHDVAEAIAFAGTLERSGFRTTTVSSLEAVSDDDVGIFEGAVLGPVGPLEQRAEHCRKMREDGYAGAILATCTDVTDGEALLHAGADDFVTAPLNPLELIARLRACVRRASARSHLRWGPLDLDRMGRVLRLHGRTVPLTARECELLACLIEGGGRVVSRAGLRERVWRRKEDRGSNLVEVHLSRLRDKLGEESSLIETVRRAGYRLRR
jgi:DNA-binding response OmpR family regulator